MYKSGFKFKETHSEIHYVRDGHGKPRDKYSKNFTKEFDKRRTFASGEEAEETVLCLMSTFERHDDYRWTPVIINLSNGDVKTIISSRWHPSCNRS